VSTDSTSSVSSSTTSWNRRHGTQCRLAVAEHVAGSIRAGDLYYLPPGHTGVVVEDFECIEFSPSAAHEQVIDIVKRSAAMAQTTSA
jgi:hypothetical protein